MASVKMAIVGVLVAALMIGAVYLVFYQFRNMIFKPASVAPVCSFEGVTFTCSDYFVLDTNGRLLIGLGNVMSEKVVVEQFMCTQKPVGELNWLGGEATNVSMPLGIEGKNSLTAQCYGKSGAFGGNPGDRFSGNIFVQYMDEGGGMRMARGTISTYVQQAQPASSAQ